MRSSRHTKAIGRKRRAAGWTLLLFGLLVGFDNAFKIGFNGNPFGLGAGEKFRFEFWIDGDAHDFRLPVTRRL